MRSAIEEIDRPCVLVDARSCTDEIDLAMAIAYQEQMHGDDLEDVVEEEPDEAASGDWTAEE